MDNSLIKPVAEDIDFPGVRLVDPPRIWANAPPWRWELVMPDHYNFWYALSGAGEMRIDGERFEIRPGRAFLLFPGCRVEAGQNDRRPITNFAAHFLFRNETGRLPRGALPFVAADVPSASEFGVRVREITAAARQPGPLAAREVEAMVFLAIARVWRHQCRGGSALLQKLDTLLDEIDAAPGRFQRVEILLARMGVSTAHLRRLFMERVGMSPISYVTRRRTERAKELLAASPLSVKEIAHSLGYEDPLYFSRQFKRWCGLSPQHWRERAQSE